MLELNFKTKAEYLIWKAEWKEQYKELSAEIRKAKQARKEYKWQYRPKGATTMKKKTKVGSNPNYDPSLAYWKLPVFRMKARRMMELRQQAKELSIKQKKELIAA